MQKTSGFGRDVRSPPQSRPLATYHSMNYCRLQSDEDVPEQEQHWEPTQIASTCRMPPEVHVSGTPKEVSRALFTSSSLDKPEKVLREYGLSPRLILESGSSANVLRETENGHLKVRCPYKKPCRVNVEEAQSMAQLLEIARPVP
ncbi:hypothetical protein NDU88_004441 [Pleurodeles waltl]|uniref:Prolactin receptor n=1 Tax=Pleurodeles waltl TaxID=8319 RepID=A0AAV7UJ78_PLEWA|nr:hypothetical protein NDU88_004441 [Pleurodeles waltl]